MSNCCKIMSTTLKTLKIGTMHFHSFYLQFVLYNWFLVQEINLPTIKMKLKKSKSWKSKDTEEVAQLTPEDEELLEIQSLEKRIQEEVPEEGFQGTR
jgi:hypothetical protein